MDTQQTEFMLEASRKFGFDMIKVDPNAVPKLLLLSHAFATRVKKLFQPASGAPAAPAPGASAPR